MRRLLLVGLLLIGTAGICTAARPPIGTNVNGLSYSSTELPFLDAFKNAGAWTSGTVSEWSDSRPLDLDSRGWVRSLKPGQVANMALFHDTAKFGGALSRRYLVQYEGLRRLSTPPSCGRGDKSL